MSTNKAKKGLCVVALAATLSLTGTATAFATTDWVGGGRWNWGVASLWPADNWSHYLQWNVDHGSSVTGDRGLVRSACEAPGDESHSWAWDSNIFRIDQAYWRYC